MHDTLRPSTQSCKNLAVQSTALSRLRFPPKSPIATASSLL